MLQKSDRFQNDIKKYQEIISEISDPSLKSESTKLLNELISEVRKMDSMYLDMIYSNQLNSLGSELRDKVVSIRKKLNTKLGV